MFKRGLHRGFKMIDAPTDSEIQHFFDELEQCIRIINHETIHARIPEITRETVLAIEISAARLRSKYLEAVCRIDPNDEEGTPKDEQVWNLRKSREAYEEVLKAHDTLLHAVKRGYVQVVGLKTECEVPVSAPGTAPELLQPADA